MTSLVFTKNYTIFFIEIVALFLLSLLSSSSYYCFSLHPLIKESQAKHQNFTAVSDFRVVNRRALGDCLDLNPYQQINVSSDLKLGDEEYVTVTVTGVLFPSENDWIGMISPSHSEYV